MSEPPLSRGFWFIKSYDPHPHMVFSMLYADGGVLVVGLALDSDVVEDHITGGLSIVRLSCVFHVV